MHFFNFSLKHLRKIFRTSIGQWKMTLITGLSTYNQVPKSYLNYIYINYIYNYTFIYVYIILHSVSYRNIGIKYKVEWLEDNNVYKQSLRITMYLSQL